MIVGDDIGLLRLMHDALDPLLPTLQFALLVEIVVALVAIIGVEPMIVVASVQADVRDWSVTCSVGASDFPITG